MAESMNTTEPRIKEVVPFCCSIDCSADAEWDILTVRGDSGMAGPDPYSDNTQACTAHVGDLLGYQPDAHNPEEIYWHVMPIRETV